MNIISFNIPELRRYIDQNSAIIAALSPNQLVDLICDLATLLNKYKEADIINILNLLLVRIFESNKFIIDHRIGLNAIFTHYYSAEGGISFSIRLLESGASTFFINTLHSFHFNFNHHMNEPPFQNSAALRTNYRNTIADAIVGCTNIIALKDQIASMDLNSLHSYSLGCVILGLASLLFKYPESAILEILELILSSNHSNRDYVFQYYYHFRNKHDSDCGHCDAINPFSLQLILNGGATRGFIHTLHSYRFHFNPDPRRMPPGGCRTIQGKFYNIRLCQQLLYNLMYLGRRSPNDYLHIIQYLITNKIVTVNKDIIIAAIDFSTIEIFQCLLDDYTHNNMTELLAIVVVAKLENTRNFKTADTISAGILLIERGACLNDVIAHYQISPTNAILKGIQMHMLITSRMPMMMYCNAYKQADLHKRSMIDPHKRSMIDPHKRSMKIFFSRLNTNKYLSMELLAFMGKANFLPAHK
jgi:hypothetical protein